MKERRVVHHRSSSSRKRSREEEEPIDFQSPPDPYLYHHMIFLLNRLNTEPKYQYLVDSFWQTNQLYFNLIYPFVFHGLEKRKKSIVDCDQFPIILNRSSAFKTYDVFDHLYCLKFLWKKGLRPELSTLMLPCIACSKVRSMYEIEYVVHFECTHHIRLTKKKVYQFPLIASKSLKAFHVKNLFFEKKDTGSSTTLLSWIPDSYAMIYQLIQHQEEDDD